MDSAGDDISPEDSSLPDWSRGSVAVLASGGLDSAILVGEMAKSAKRVVPIYVRFGLVWEEIERRSLERFLPALASPVVEPLMVFDMPIAPVYGRHWSTTGEDSPGADTPDEAVYLPGRNLFLTVQAGVWCHLNGVETLALAPLASNPFPDSTDAFFYGLEATINRAVGGDLRIRRPYGRLHKMEVMKRGVGMPLEATFSCIRPVGEAHCGQCNKCAERRRAFADAEMVDRTLYAA